MTHSCMLILCTGVYSPANSGEVVIHEALLQALDAPPDGSSYGTDCYRASQQRWAGTKEGQSLRLCTNWSSMSLSMCLHQVGVPYSRKLSREKTVTNFTDLLPFVKVFYTKMGVVRFS